jgi:hypothetical protein
MFSNTPFSKLVPDDNIYHIGYGYVLGRRNKKMERKYDCQIYFDPSVLQTSEWPLPDLDIVILDDEIGIAFSYSYEFAVYEKDEDSPKELRAGWLYNGDNALRFGKTGALRIEWLPPRLERVKQIDYSKFGFLPFDFDIANPYEF